LKTKQRRIINMRAIYTLKELADYLRVSTATVTRMIEKEEIAAHKVGGQWRIMREELERYLDASNTLAER
jgi:excisionase family DNA binding protein